MDKLPNVLLCHIAMFLDTEIVLKLRNSLFKTILDHREFLEEMTPLYYALDNQKIYILEKYKQHNLFPIENIFDILEEDLYKDRVVDYILANFETARKEYYNLFEDFLDDGNLTKFIYVINKGRLDYSFINSKKKADIIVFMRKIIQFCYRFCVLKKIFQNLEIDQELFENMMLSTVKNRNFNSFKALRSIKKTKRYKIKNQKQLRSILFTLDIKMRNAVSKFIDTTRSKYLTKYLIKYNKRYLCKNYRERLNRYPNKYLIRIKK